MLNLIFYKRLKELLIYILKLYCDSNTVLLEYELKKSITLHCSSSDQDIVIVNSHKGLNLDITV